MNRDRLVEGKPRDRANPKANGEGVALRIKDRGCIVERPRLDLEDPDPTGEPGHIADELIASLHALGNVALAGAKARDHPVRATESLVGVRGEEVKEVSQGLP